MSESLLVPLLRSSLGPLLVPLDDPLRRLSPGTARALVQSFQVRSTDELLRLSDRRILGAVRQAEHLGDRAVEEAGRWLLEQRAEQGDLVSSPLEARTRAADTLAGMRAALAEAIVRAIKRERLAPEEVARRAGTSREAVVSLCAGQVSSNLELLLKLAAVLSIRVRFEVLD